MNLIHLGWNSDLQNHYEPWKEQGYSVGRIVQEHKNVHKVMTLNGELFGEISGKMRFDSLNRSDLPAVGDWVILKENGMHAMIHTVLPRKSKLSRNVAGAKTEEQILATNIDTVFLMNALNQDFNLRRIERYLILAWESGATPVIVLSKADLCDDMDQVIADVQSVAFDVPIHPISTVNGMGLNTLQSYFKQGASVALIGSSGVGKSTLINTLVGKEVQRVNEIRHDDGRGKHTTTHRELIILPDGGMIIDTPGMRELKLQSSHEGFSSTFEDIELLTSQCFFNDCKHQKEPGCAILMAIDNGELEAKRYENYLKMQRELAHIAKREKEKSKKNERFHFKHKKGKRFN